MNRAFVWQTNIYTESYKCLWICIGTVQCTSISFHTKQNVACSDNTSHIIEILSWRIFLLYVILSNHIFLHFIKVASGFQNVEVCGQIWSVYTGVGTAHSLSDDGGSDPPSSSTLPPGNGFTLWSVGFGFLGQSLTNAHCAFNASYSFLPVLHCLCMLHNNNFALSLNSCSCSYICLIA
jgi:hypothetical protein